MSYTIITHDGKAHLDELLASALLAVHLGESPAEIKRIHAQDASELVASGDLPENSYFIDCGMALDPSKGLFDHHQDRDLDSAVMLVFKEYFQHLAGTELESYIKLVSRVDTQGIMSLEDFHLVSESKDYFSFGQGVLLRKFETDPLLILEIFMEGLKDKIAFEKAKQQAAQWLDQDGNITISQVGSLNVIQYLKKPPSELVAALRSQIAVVVDQEDVSAIFAFDDKRPEIRTLFRTDIGHDGLDFSKARPHETIFCHPAGFFLKFIPSHGKEWLSIVEDSIV